MNIEDTVVKISGSFHNLALLTVDRHHIVHRPLAFRIDRNATMMTGSEPATFGSASKRHNHCTTTAGTVNLWCVVVY